MLLPAIVTVRETPEVLGDLRARLDAVIVVDCARLERCDAAGLQLLIALHQARGGNVSFANVPADLAWRFAFAGLPVASTDATPEQPHE